MLFDAILADSEITTVRSGVQMPRMNAIMERWVRTCRAELLDRTLIWNQRQLIRALREYEDFYNAHRVRHEVQLDRAEVEGLRQRPVVAGRLKWEAA